MHSILTFESQHQLKISSPNSERDKSRWKRNQEWMKLVEDIMFGTIWWELFYSVTFRLCDRQGTKLPKCYNGMKIEFINSKEKAIFCYQLCIEPTQFLETGFHFYQFYKYSYKSCSPVSDHVLLYHGLCDKIL